MKSTYRILLGLALALILVVPSPVAAQSYSEGDARSDVGQLRHLYGVATDLIAAGNFSEGRDIYRRIFTADVRICIFTCGIVQVNGPDAWATFVDNALNPCDCQHLLGSQVIEIDDLPRGNPGTSNASGHATMSTYLQAWQAFDNSSDPDDGQTLSTFIGTYFDKARVTRGVGWQIYDMLLTRTSGDTRQINVADSE